MTDEIIKQQQAEQLVNRHVIEEINETIQKEFNETPEIIYEAENYEKNKKELNKGINKDYWDEPEIYEFWSVDDWLYEKLKAKGEIVFDCLDFHVWGRQTTGQAIYMDSVIQRIAEEIY
jgi:hypothetical protein